MGDGIAHLYLAGRLDARNDIPHIACTDHLPGVHPQPEDPYLIGIVLFFGGDELDQVPLADLPVDNLKIGDDPPEGVEHRIKNQRLQRSLGISLGWWYPLNNTTENFLHAHTGLSAGLNDIVGITSDQIDDLLRHPFGHGTIHIHLVHHRNDFQIVFQGKVEVGDGLRLDTLGGVNDEQGTFAGRNRA